MILKKLELFGFKSFAERTILEFEPGITAIVGPNGCGKSNIVDAIKWVLGEQSAKELRGSSMEDVIFNGTEYKEKVNFAEVSLYISNEEGKLPIDFTEVVITRRLFRTGESEYLINRVPVRLRDIQELIAGTGIGTKAYSLMEQGKIDLLLSSKPEERRFVFEEASGITKFKAKKKEAMRKLEQTENNLLRLSDVINEVRRQISSLERQAKKAERYKLLYEELKEKEIKLTGFRIKGCRQVISSYLKEKERIEGEIKGIEEKLKAEEAKAKQLRDKLSILSEEIADQENNLNSFRLKKERDASKITWSQETILELEDRLKDIDLELSDIEKGIEKGTKKLEEMEKEKAHFEEERNKLKGDLEKKRQGLSELKEEYKRSKDEVEELKGKILAQNMELTQKRNLLLELEGELKGAKLRLERLRFEREDLINEIKAQEDKLKASLKEMEEIQGQLDQLKVVIERMQTQKQQLQAKLEDLKTEKADLEKKIVSLEAKLTSWRQVLEKDLGYPEAVKLIKQEKQDKVLGLLSELVGADMEYLNVVETALLPYLDAVVVKDRESALELLSFCKERGLYDLKILILEELRGRTFSYQIEGVIPLRQIIKVSGGLEGLSSLFDDIFYVEDVQRALTLSLEFPDYTFVTKDNLRLKRGEICIGLNPEQDLGYIGREEKIKAVEDELRILKDKLRGLEEEEAKTSEEIKEAEQVLEEKIKEFENLNIKLAEVRKTKESLEEVQAKLLQEKEILDLDIEELEAQLKGYLDREERLKAEIEGMQSRLNSHEERLSLLQSKLTELRNQEHARTLELTQLEANLSSLEERQAQLDNWYKGLQEELEALRKNKEKKERERQEIRARIDQVKMEVSNLQQEMDKLEEDIKTAEEILEEKKVEYEGLRKEFEREEDLLMEMRNAFTAKKEEVHAVELQINEENFKIQSLRDRLRQVYDVQEIDEENVEVEDPVALEEEISTLQQKLNSMGEVNLVAIEEHKRLKERLAFLESQERDLIEAKESLLSAIRKINKTTRQMFSQTFQQIRQAFKEIFPRLFGGGDADLVLEEGVDCLEAGIEILARPPGKKLQSVSLLSGGEKALTALSLLFAIFKVNPSPFCILDEVDAPLDEANIDRFRKLLEEFAQRSQFLVITHNKRTIATADVIYGITMEDTGVSKIVSVKFRKERVKEGASA